MFFDLVGSTGLAAKLDAEDWRNLVNAYLDEASKAVTGLGGHVLKRLGDGLMALFGYPRAQENDAERAVRAALAIQRALAELNARNAARGAPELSRASGSSPARSSWRRPAKCSATRPNVAARVEAAAEPGSVLVTVGVQRQVAGLFVAEDAGRARTQRRARAGPAFRIVRASGGGAGAARGSHPSRRARGGARPLAPALGAGREGEGQLALDRRRTRHRQVAPRGGVSRDARRDAAHLDRIVVVAALAEYAAASDRRMGPPALWRGLPAERRLADLENTLGLIGLDPAEYAPLLAPLVDIPLPDERVAKLAPEELRRRQLAALVAWVLAGARSQPVALAFEDLHWADPTSLDLLQALAERGAQAPLLISRPRGPSSARPGACARTTASSR